MPAACDRLTPGEEVSMVPAIGQPNRSQYAGRACGTLAGAPAGAAAPYNDVPPETDRAAIRLVPWETQYGVAAQSGEQLDLPMVTTRDEAEIL
jgi:hypothetical protein